MYTTYIYMCIYIHTPCLQNSNPTWNHLFCGAKRVRGRIISSWGDLQVGQGALWPCSSEKNKSPKCLAPIEFGNQLLIKTARSLVFFCGALSCNFLKNVCYWKRVEESIFGFFGQFFLWWTLSKQRCLSTQEFTCLLSTGLFTSLSHALWCVLTNKAIWVLGHCSIDNLRIHTSEGDSLIFQKQMLHRHNQAQSVAGVCVLWRSYGKGTGKVSWGFWTESWKGEHNRESFFENNLQVSSGKWESLASWRRCLWEF